MELEVDGDNTTDSNHITTECNKFCSSIETEGLAVS